MNFDISKQQADNGMAIYNLQFDNVFDQSLFRWIIVKKLRSRISGSNKCLCYLENLSEMLTKISEIEIMLVKIRGSGCLVAMPL